MIERLLIVAPNFPLSDDRIISTWALNQALGFQEAGATVTVVSPSPYVPDFVGRLIDGYRWAGIPERRQFDGLDVFYPKAPVYQSTRLRNGLYEWIPELEGDLGWYLGWKSCASVVEKFDPDALLCHHPLPGGVLGQRIKKQYGVPFATIEHSLYDIRRNYASPRRRDRYESVLESADAVLTVSEMMRTALFKRTNLDRRIQVVYNGYSPKEVH